MTSRGLWILAVVVLAACPRPGPQDACKPASFGTGGGSATSGTNFRIQGDDITLELFVAMECPDDVEVRAIVTVQDPNNDEAMLLDGESTRVVTDRTSSGMTTVVKVHAGLPGPYHFTARFEPNLGLVQRDVLVAENRRDAGAELVVPPGSTLASCSHVDLTEDGRPLCLSQAVRVFDRSGGVTQTLTTSGVGARAGHVLWVRDSTVLWVRDSTVLRRWLETDAGFVLDGDAGVVVPTAAVLAAEEESVLAAGSFEVMRVRHTDAGTLVAEVDPNLIANNPVGVWKRGEEYVVLGTSGSDSTVCSGRFRDAGTCTQAFQPTQVRPVASEPAGLWTAADDFLSVTTLQLRSPALREFVVPTGWTVTPGVVGWDTGAVLTSETGAKILVGDRSGSIVLQSFPPDTLRSVTSRWVTMQRSNGELVIYRR